MFHTTTIDVFFPYCIQRLEDGRHIVLNRRYKPLGIRDETYVDYAAHPSATHIPSLTPTVAQQLSVHGDANVEVIHLYNDGTVPDAGNEHWDAYAARLKVLSGLLLPDA